jgi:hypothetical protein
MSKPNFAIQLVGVPPSDTPPTDGASDLQVAQNALHGPLGDADLSRHLAHRGIGILGQTNHHVRVVREKCPVRFAHGSGAGILRLLK